MTNENDSLNAELNGLLAGLDSDDEVPTLKPVVKKAVSEKKTPAKKAKSEEDSWTKAEREARKKKEHKYKPGEMRTILVQKDREKGGDRPIPVTYNGKTYTVPRGVKVPVPAPVAEILVNAEETVVEWDDKANIFHERTAASYPTAVSM